MFGVYHTFTVHPILSTGLHVRCLSYTYSTSRSLIVLVSVSCPKALYHLESDNLFRITEVVADWLG